jgi:hypothetical protein
MKTVIEMAREAGVAFDSEEYPDIWMTYMNVGRKEIEAFAELIRADQEEKYKWDIHSCGPTCQRYACVAIREAVEAEREACAKVCESEWSNVAERMYGEECAAAIRARGNT